MFIDPHSEREDWEALADHLHAALKANDIPDPDKIVQLIIPVLLEKGSLWLYSEEVDFDAIAWSDT